MRRSPPSPGASRATPTSPGNYWDYDWANNNAVDYDNITTFYRSDVDPAAKNVKSSPRTREITLGLEREVTPDLTASAIATFRRSDNFDWAKLYYPADVFPSTPDLVVDGTSDWYAAAGTVPDTITVGEGTSAVTYDLLDAGGRTWYLPIATFPGETPYRMVDKTQRVPDLPRPRALPEQEAGQALVHERLASPSRTSATTGRTPRSIRPTSGPSTARPTATGAPATTARPRS